MKVRNTDIHTIQKFVQMNQELSSEDFVNKQNGRDSAHSLKPCRSTSGKFNDGFKMGKSASRVTVSSRDDTDEEESKDNSQKRN